MVSVKEAVAIGFDAALTGLADFIKANAGVLTPEAGFGRFVYDAAEETAPADMSLPPMSEEILEHGQAPALAAGGFALSRCAPPPSIRDAYAAGLERLSLKDAFALDHQTFAFRPVEVLGIALGAVACDVPAPLRSWLTNVLTRLQSESGGDYWSRSLNRVAAAEIGVTWAAEALPDLEQARIEELAIRRWLASVGPRFGWATDDRMELMEVDGILLERFVTQNEPLRDVARAALVHCSVRRALFEHIRTEVARDWQIGDARRDSLRLVEQLCRRFPAAARALAQRQRSRRPFKISDEYDVQDLMHALLCMHFSDVRPEEWAPSYAGNASRVDFLLKREKIVVEAKMMRKGLTQKLVADQLIQDKERYKTHPDCDALVCFIYDPGGRCSNPAALETDLAEAKGDGPAVSVIVSPSGV
jgi:REase_DpnII-MboI